LAGPGLYVWGGGGLREARARREGGARVVVWPGGDPRLLEGEGLAARSVTDVIGAEGEAAVLAAERGFARVWARLPLVEGASFRDLVPWRGESLLWACESYLLRATAGPRCAAAVERCLRLLEATDPCEVDAGGLAPENALLLARAAVARGVLFHGEAPRGRALAAAAADLPAWASPRSLIDRLGSRRGSAGAPVLALHDGGPAAPLVAALAARGRDEPSLAVDVVPAEELPRRETADARAGAAAAERALRETLGRLRGTPGLAASYAHRGIGFAELAALDLEAVLLGHLPGAARVAERARGLLADAAARLLVVGIEDRDLRRAVGLAARVAGVPWIAVTTADAASDERVDGGPQPLARVSAGAEGAVDLPLARLLAAARDSVGPR
jgi:hypothetical protein